MAAEEAEVESGRTEAEEQIREEGEEEEAAALPMKAPVDPPLQNSAARTNLAQIWKKILRMGRSLTSPHPWRIPPTNQQL